MKLLSNMDDVLLENIEAIYIFMHIRLSFRRFWPSVALTDDYY